MDTFSPASSQSPRYSKVKIHLSQDKNLKSFLISPSLTNKDLKDILYASFNINSIAYFVGFEDADDGTIYPFSSILTHYKFFHNKALKILLSKEYEINYTNNIDVPKNTNAAIGDKVLATFSFLDLNCDGKIDRNEMIQSLTSALSYLEFNVENRIDSSENIANLAEKITESCFQFLGLDDELYASLDDFTAWYLSIGENKYRELMIRAIEAYDESIGKKSRLSTPVALTNASNQAFDFSTTTEISESPMDEFFLSIINIKTAIGLDHVSLKSVYDSLRAEAIISHVQHHEVDGTYHKVMMISRTLFLKRFESLASVTAAHHIRSQESFDINKLLLMLFNTFHPSYHNDTVPLSSIMCGLSLFYMNSQEDTLRQLFKIICDIRDSKDRMFISDRTFRDFLYQHIKLSYVLSTSIQQLSQTDAESFTLYMYGRVLKTVQREYFGVFNQLEFVEAAKIGLETVFLFINNDSEVVKGYKPMHILRSHGTRMSSNIAEATIDGFDHLSPKILQTEDINISLLDARIVLGLLTSSPMTIFQLFRLQEADSDGNLSIVSYHHVINKLFRHFYSNLSILDRMIADYIIDRIFELFRIDNRNMKDSGDKVDNHGERMKDSDLADKKCDILDITLAMISLCGGDAHVKASCITEVFRFFGDDSDIHNVSMVTNSTDKNGDSSHQSIEMSFINERALLEITDEGSPISFEYVAMCTEPLIIMISGLNPLLSDREIIEDFSYELTTFGFHHFFQDAVELSVDQFEHWFEILFILFDRDYGQGLLEKAIIETQSLSAEEKSLNLLKYSLQGIYKEKYPSSPSERVMFDNKEGNNEGIAESGLSLDFDDNNGQVGDGVTIPSSTAVIISELKESSSLLGLDGFSADDIMETLGECAQNGRISLDDWLKIVKYSLCLGSIDESSYESATILACDLFNAFQAIDNQGNDSSGVNSSTVSYVLFASGLSVLSSSPIEDRLSVSFALHDSNSDQLINIDEYQSLVHSHILVTISCSKLANSRLKELQSKYPISINDLAQAVALECYAALSLDKSSELTLESVCEIGNDCLVLAENIAL